MGPSLMHMRGFRFFCFKQPSFPDPSIGADGQRTQSGEAQNYYVYTNYHCPGEARMDNGRSLFLAAYRNTDTNSNGAWYSDGVNGGGNQTVDGALKQLLGFGTPFSTNAAGNDESQLGAGSTKATEPIHRARFYINWLTLNPADTRQTTGKTTTTAACTTRRRSTFRRSTQRESAWTPKALATRSRRQSGTTKTSPLTAQTTTTPNSSMRQSTTPPAACPTA